MIRTDEVIALLKAKGKKMSFDKIWKEVKEPITESISVEMDEVQIKSNLYISLIEDEHVIMVGDNNWDLKERYSLDNLGVIEKSRMTEETELQWEESDDTRELKLSIVYKDEEVEED